MTTTFNINLSANAPVFDVTLGNDVSFAVASAIPSAVAFGTTAGTAAEGNDPRLSDSRQPLAHKQSHSIGGTDRILPEDIGAQGLFESGSVTFSPTNPTSVALGSARAKTWSINAYNAGSYEVILPSTNKQAGDIAVIRTGTVVSNATVAVKIQHNGYTTTAVALTAGSQSVRYVSSNTSSSGWAAEPVSIHTHQATDITDFTSAVAAAAPPANFASPPAIGSTAPAAGAFTTLNSTVASGSGITVTDTNTSADFNNLIECVRDSNSVFLVRDDGIVTASLGVNASTNAGLVTASGGNGGVRIRADYSLHWVSTGFTNTGTPDTFLRRDAQANTLAMYNSTNAQEFRLYNTRTSSTNFERLSIGWVSNIVSIKPEAGGSGGTVRELHISGLPTSNPGPGILWNDSGTVKVGT